MSIAQILAILWARKALVAAFVMATLIGAVAMLELLPRSYDATSTIYFRLADRDPATNEQIPQMVQRNFLQTQMELLRSRGVALKVVELLGLADKPSYREAFQKATGGAGDIANWIAADLTSGLKIDRAGASDIITVTYRARDPKWAAELANTFVTAYIRKDVDVRAGPARDLFQWYEERLVQLRQRFAELNTRRSVLLQASLQEGDSKVAAREDPLRLANEATTARLEFMQAKAALDLAKANSDVHDNEETRQLRRQIAETNALIARDTRVLGPEHQRIKTLKMNKTTLEDQLTTALQRVASENLTNAQQRVAIAERRFKEVSLTLSQLDQVDADQANSVSSLTALDREIETLKAQIASIVERRERIRLEGATEQGLASRLTEAVAPTSPAFPKPQLVLGFALGLGLPFGIALAILREMFDRRVRLPSDIESYTDLPLLAVVPIARRRASRGRRSRDILATANAGHPLLSKQSAR